MRAPRVVAATAIFALAALTLGALAAAGAPNLTITAPAGALVYTPLNTSTLSGAVDPAGSALSLDGGPDFSDGSGAFSLTLSLTEGANNFSLQATDSLGESAWFNFTVVADFTPPNITIAEPPEVETITNAPTVPVEGHVDDANGVAFMILNGVVLTLDAEGNFSLNYRLTDGLNVLLFEAQDLARNDATLVRTVTYDRYAPFLLVDAPVDGLRTKSTAVTVIGRTERDARVTVNGDQAPVDPLVGSFALNITLLDLSGETENRIVIRATDRAGNIAFAYRSVTVDTLAPSIELDIDPVTRAKIEGGTPLNASSLTLRGSTDTLDATVEVNGEVVPLEVLSFEITVLLHEGTNIILILASDDLENQRTLRLIVVRDSTPPTLTMSSPATPSMRTSSRMFTIEGTVGGGPDVVVFVRFIDQGGAIIEGIVFPPKPTPDSFPFEYELVLYADGEAHEVTVEAVDEAGNRVALAFTYTVITAIPSLSLDPLPSTVSQTGFWVNGTTSAQVETVRVNGEGFPVVDGMFAVWWELPASTGVYTVTVVVADDVGNENRRDIEVTLHLPPLPDSVTLRVDGASVEHVEAGVPVRLSLDGGLAPGVTVVWSVDGEVVGAGQELDITLSAGDHTVGVLLSNGGQTETYTFTLHAGTSGGLPGASGGGEMAIVALMTAGVGAAIALAFVVRERRRRGP